MSDTLTLLYLCGLPGVGKSTVAALLARDTGWPLLWHHAFDAIFRVVQSSRVPQLVNELVPPVLRHLMASRQTVIYARSTCHEDTMSMLGEVTLAAGYRLAVVRLVAGYRTLCQRIAGRPASEFRVNSREQLDDYLDYLDGSAQVRVPGEVEIATEGKTPEEVAERVRRVVEQEGVASECAVAGIR